MSHIGWEGEQTTLITVWKSSSNRRVLNPWREARKGPLKEKLERRTNHTYKGVEIFP